MEPGCKGFPRHRSPGRKAGQTRRCRSSSRSWATRWWDSPSTHYIGNVPANRNHAWTPNGFKSFDNTTWDHSQVHQFSWKFGNYPGYWYAWVKSICTHTERRGEGAIYRFLAKDKLPAHPHGGGWRR
jgi:hypothetical protein